MPSGAFDSAGNRATVDRLHLAKSVVRSIVSEAKTSAFFFEQVQLVTLGKLVPGRRKKLQ